MRGRLVSRPVDEVLREAENLVRAGVQELLVVSQDTSAYGLDLRYAERPWRDRQVAARMTDLARELGQLGAWVRLHYVYPYPHVDEVIPLMSGNGLLPYLDIPFQHASPRILKAMRRPAHSEKVIERVRSWRSLCPEITLRSTFIVGFPGETEDDFQQLLDFLEQAQLDRVGCFTYSAVDGAAANALADPVPAEIAQERFERFMQLQAVISTRRLAAKIGSVQEILVDEIDEDGALGRSKADAPEIDGVVRIHDGHALKPGQRVRVRIEASDEHDLAGSLTQ
jgi:ribosomal protein S12 methylthiotransferase